MSEFWVASVRGSGRVGFAGDGRDIVAKGVGCVKG